MRVFVTGASGWVGSAVTRDLIAHGHKVLGLARSDASAKTVADAGGEPHRGGLDDLDCLQRGAATCDGVIHTAFNHDFSNMAAGAALDKAAIETMGAALEGSGRPFIVSSGMGSQPGRVGTENDPTPEALAALTPRKSEEHGLSMAARGVRAMVVRLAPSVHGEGDHGLVPMLIRTAREKGFAFYVDDGKNRWPAVHRFDAARIYRLALEKGTAGSRFHGVAEEGIAIREIAESIGRHLEVPVVSKAPEESFALLGFIGRVLGLDIPASSALTQERLGWHPNEPGLLADLDEGHYFDT
jgi:nucleoside-diphosphate-sugar epimerase